MRFRMSGNPCEQGIRFSPDDGGAGGGEGGSDSSDGGDSFLEDVILDLGDGQEGVADKKTSIFSADEGQGGDEDEDNGDKGEEGKESKKSGKAKGKEGEEGKEGEGDSEEDGDKDGEDQDADKKGKNGESATIREMRDVLRAQKKEIKELRKKIEGDGKDGKVKEEEKPELTRDQLAAILEEHRDEPEVLLNVMEYIHKQGLKKAEQVKEVVEAQKQIAMQVDSVLSKGLGDAYKPEDWQEEIDAKIPADKWGLVGNPLEPQIRRLMYIAGHFDSVVEMRVKERVAEAIKKYKETGEKVEKKRVEKITNTSVPKGASGGAADKSEKSTARSEMVAKEIGLSPSGKKLYDQFRTSKK